MLATDPTRKAARIVLAAMAFAVASPAGAKESLRLPTGLEEARVGYVHGVIIDGKYFAWGHFLELSPEWHPTDWLSLGAQLNLGQDIASGRGTTLESSGEAVLSDLLLTVASPGVTVPGVGIRAGGAVQLLLPTSRYSQRASLQAGVGPGIELVRDFPVLHKLTLRYAARFLFTFYRYAERAGVSGLNSVAVLAHGPGLELRPIRSLCVSATVLGTTAFVRGPKAPDRHWYQRSGLWFSASVDYRVLDAFGLGVGFANDTFAVLPEASPYTVAPLPVTVFLRLSLWPAQLFD